ncbi:beta-ketoacyl-ACP synthase III [Acetohalobium arabaticum]|uniref:Beta-ketoacyl-[acyl-carrier-protein] synthase III n=1 Tax=Acetohalobium arabaticum (strain ATCC 49924 / DSM 5501 / Z-7288) TaxID=574087 RepID=D9QR53_ACEAZ|nr:beta-ketoacyl-ACP synthase III [Acetohalobium arabaticum]ADL12994.1 3-oxoacyl-(acyl-carrier-protein) synthase III [Acetohalobium arabaticum DSM 5501]
MTKKVRKAGITGVGYYVPKNILTNYDLEEMLETSDKWIKSRTGIEERRIADDNEATSDLAFKAAKKALSDAELDAEDLDLILVATMTPDMLFPATACLLQDRLNATEAAAFDLEAACSGFAYGLSVASQFIASRAYDNILVIGAETISKILDWNNRNTCILFGDGAGAAVVQPVESGGILGSILGADGSDSDLLKMPAGGSKRPVSQKTIENDLHYLEMDGNAVFKFAVRIVAKAALQVLKELGLTAEDIDFFIPHQANIRIIDAAAKRLNLNEQEVFINLDKYGNTSAASIPIALAEAVQADKIDKGDKILFVGFGAGLTWGANVIEWSY